MWFTTQRVQKCSSERSRESQQNVHSDGRKCRCMLSLSPITSTTKSDQRPKIASETSDFSNVKTCGRHTSSFLAISCTNGLKWCYKSENVAEFKVWTPEQKITAQPPVATLPVAGMLSFAKKTAYYTHTHTQTCYFRNIHYLNCRSSLSYPTVWYCMCVCLFLLLLHCIMIMILIVVYYY